jgi:hypothetical protein
MDRVPNEAASDLRHDAAKNRSLQQLNQGFVGQLDHHSEANKTELSSASDVVFATLLGQLLSVLTSVWKGKSLRAGWLLTNWPSTYLISEIDRLSRIVAFKCREYGQNNSTGLELRSRKAA